MEFDRPEVTEFDKLDFKAAKDFGFDTVELKYDGFNCALVNLNNNWQIWSRHGLLKQAGVLKQHYRRTVIYGEFLFGTEWAKERPEIYCKFKAFGAECVEGEDCTGLTLGSTRRLIEDFLVNDPKFYQEDIASRVHLVEQWPIDQAPDIWEEYVVQQKYEGLIFKKNDERWDYGFGRMKNDVTMDYVCMGFYASDSDTYAGIGVASVLGGLYVDGVLVRKCRAGGLDDTQRMEFFKNHHLYKGKVFEASGKRLSKKGSLRHPHFVRFREDKKPEECTWIPKAAVHAMKLDISHNLKAYQLEQKLLAEEDDA